MSSTTDTDTATDTDTSLRLQTRWDRLCGWTYIQRNDALNGSKKTALELVPLTGLDLVAETFCFLMNIGMTFAKHMV